VVAIHDLITEEPLISSLLKIKKKINPILFNITCIYYRSARVVGVILFHRKVGKERFLVGFCDAPNINCPRLYTKLKKEVGNITLYMLKYLRFANLA